MKKLIMSVITTATLSMAAPAFAQNGGNLESVAQNFQASVHEFIHHQLPDLLVSMHIMDQDSVNKLLAVLGPAESNLQQLANSPQLPNVSTSAPLDAFKTLMSYFTTPSLSQAVSQTTTQTQQQP